METKRLMLVDTASLYFRAFYGLPETLRASGGTPVNAVRGLLDFLARFITEYEPTELACCWDNDWRPQWRVDLLPSYKTHRVSNAGPGTVSGVVGAGGVGAETGLGEDSPDGLTPQVPIIVEALDALGLAVVGRDGYEADDVIATLSEHASGPVDIVTGDRDLFQLVDDERAVRVLYLGRGVRQHERVDNAWIRARYGVDAHRYADFASLRGDPSDGIPGVPGIGEKTAASLLNAHGDLEGILDAASQHKPPISGGVVAKLGAAIDYLAVGPEVVRVVRNIDLGDLDLTLPSTPDDPERFAELAERWSLGSAAERIVRALAAH